MEVNLLSPDSEEKGTSPPDYQHYLCMWAKEKEAQKETIKDLPKMNQVGSCATLTVLGLDWRSLRRNGAWCSSPQLSPGWEFSFLRVLSDYSTRWGLSDVLTNCRGCINSGEASFHKQRPYSTFGRRHLGNTKSPHSGH